MSELVRTQFEEGPTEAASLSIALLPKPRYAYGFKLARLRAPVPASVAGRRVSGIADAPTRSGTDDAANAARVRRPQETEPTASNNAMLSIALGTGSYLPWQRTRIWLQTLAQVISSRLSLVTAGRLTPTEAFNLAEASYKKVFDRVGPPPGWQPPETEDEK